MAKPEAEVLRAAEPAASTPCVAAEALSEAAAAAAVEAVAPASEAAAEAVAPDSEAAAELGCVCCTAPGAAMMLSMRVSTSLTAICREPFDRVDTK